MDHFRVESSLHSVVVVFGLNGVVAEALGCLLSHAGGFNVIGCQTHFGAAGSLLKDAPGAVCVVTDDLVVSASVALLGQLQKRYHSRLVLLSGSSTEFVSAFDAVVDARLGSSALFSTVRRLLDNGPADPRPKREALQVERTKLSANELEAADLIRQGLSNRKIAALMAVNEDSVKNYVRSLMNKFRCENRVQLALLLSESPSIAQKK